MVDSTSQSRAWPVVPGFANHSVMRNTRTRSDNDEWLRNELRNRGRISPSPSISQPRPGRNLQFDPNDRQYRCCCNNLSAKRGSQLIGMFYVFASFFTFIYGCMQAANIFAVSVCVPVAVIVAFSASLLLFAVHSEAPQLMIPFLILQLLGIIATAILFVYQVFILSQSAQARRERTDDKNDQKTDPIIGTGVMTVIILSAGLFVQVWFLLAVMSGYKLVRDKRKLERIGIFEEGTPRQNRGVFTTRQTETERLRAQYNLPPPPPAYCADDPNPNISSSNNNFGSSRARVHVSARRGGQLVPVSDIAIEYPPPEGDAPPGYIEACNSNSSSSFTNSSSHTRSQSDSQDLELGRIRGSGKPKKSRRRRTSLRVGLRSVSNTSEKSDSLPSPSSQINNNNTANSRSISESILEVVSLHSETGSHSGSSSHISDFEQSSE